MNKAKIMIVFTITIIVVPLMNQNPLLAKANLHTELKSQGRIRYDYGTTQNETDDACFDAQDLHLLEKRLTQTEMKILQTEQQLGIGASSASDKGGTE